MEWTVVTVLIAIVGLFATVGKPVVDLNKNLAALNAALDRLEEKMETQEKELEAQKKSAHDSHVKLWNHNDQQDKQLSDHERRIGILEHDHHLDKN